jgi:hypothetical protein
MFGQKIKEWSSSMFGGLDSRSHSEDTGHASERLPFAVNRFSFDSVNEYKRYVARYPKVFEQVWHWQMRFGDRPDPFEFSGVCESCGNLVKFSARPTGSANPAFKNQVQWWVATHCGHCGLSNRERVIVRLLEEHGTDECAINHIGTLSPNFGSYLDGKFGHPHGTSMTTFQDTALKVPVGSVDVLLAIDILEFVPDHLSAIAMVARALKPGGRAFFTVPWRGQDIVDHTVRAERLPDGTVKHHAPADYHVDPVNSQRRLRYRAFGWKVLEDLRACGFARASAEFAFAPLHGYMTMQPIIVGTR